ncbi:MAG: DsbA family protein [Myxococcaceae bacterium]|nr:DsbA family protein [Myxococcaceae bacterium]MCI0672562.1 DsbA family protein [Myxococcaceae bacterium]
MAVAGCKPEQKAAAPTAAEPSPDTVVATYGAGQKVTYGELNDRLADPLGKLQQQMHQMRRQGLEGMVTERLVQEQAKKRGLTEEQFIKAEVDDKVPAPPEDQVKKLYEEAKTRLPPGTTYEQVKPQIVDYLTQDQKRARAQELFTQLRKDANVQLTLPEPPVQRKEVAATGPSKGPENAPVTIVEFSDFQCPFCSRVIKTLDDVVKEYDGKVRLVFRHFPLDFHKQAPKAAEAAMCAADQNKFWEYHDALFANQQALEPEKLKEYAKQVGLDPAKFDACLDSGEKAAQVQKDMEAGKAAGVSGTPAFFINGRPLSGALPPEEFKRVIDAELQAKGVKQG